MFKNVEYAGIVRWQGLKYDGKQLVLVAVVDPADLAAGFFMAQLHHGATDLGSGTAAGDPEPA